MNDRAKKLQQALPSQGIGALLVSQPSNIFYLTGFRSLSPGEREAFVLVTRNNMFLATDGRYAAEASENKSFILRLLTPQKGLVKHLQDITEQEQITKVGFEREDLKWGEYEAIKKHVHAELVPVDRLIIGMRAVKDKEEITRIKKACGIGDRCLEEAAKIIHPGMTEKEIAWKMEKWVREKGFEFSFDPIVAVDKNAALPHYNTKDGSGAITENSVLLIDMGIRYEGYCSDITRMFFVGHPAPEVHAAYEKLKKAQEKTLQFLNESTNLKDADIFCREELEQGGLPSYPHSTGHGVGLEVHEYPKLSALSADIKKPGQVFTVEPGVYFPGKWGLRIEDTVAVDGEGNITKLTLFPKTLRVI